MRQGNESFPMDYFGMEKWLETFKSPQEFMDAFRGKTGWTLALIRTNDKPKFVRFQLQSEPPTSEETGEVHCITGKDFPDTTLKALKFILSKREYQKQVKP